MLRAGSKEPAKAINRLTEDELRAALTTSIFFVLQEPGRGGKPHVSQSRAWDLFSSYNPDFPVEDWPHAFERVCGIVRANKEQGLQLMHLQWAVNDSVTRKGNYEAALDPPPSTEDLLRFWTANRGHGPVLVYPDEPEVPRPTRVAA